MESKRQTIAIGKNVNTFELFSNIFEYFWTIVENNE